MSLSGLQNIMSHPLLISELPYIQTVLLTIRLRLTKPTISQTHLSLPKLSLISLRMVTSNGIGG